MKEDKMSSLIDAINAPLRKWPLPLLDEIFGSQDASFIAETINTFCQVELGSAIAKTEFFESSVGAVFGLCLTDGRRVVIKAHPPQRSPDFLRAIVQTQLYLVDNDYPCPRPLSGPHSLVRGYALVEELIDEGDYTTADDPVIRRSVAEYQARLLNLTRQPQHIPGLIPAHLDRRLPPDQLWPVPHNAIFDFEATTAGAEWIDELVRQARIEIVHGAGEIVVGHMDWSIKHFRYVHGKVRVIYDWDSLALEKEPIVVAGAATTFTYTEFFGPARIPARKEAYAFVSEYEEYRGKPFSKGEYRTLSAAVTCSLAYGARCEHCLSPSERPYPEGSGRAFLARYGNSFLAF